MTEWKDGMKRMAGRLLAIGLGLGMGLAGMGLAGMAQGQTLFSPAITVNNTVITQFELNQRLDFLQALRQTGDLAGLARDGLISDRLQLDAAKRTRQEGTALFRPIHYHNPHFQ